MATKKKLLEAAAGSAGGGAGLNVEEVFSTYLYDGSSSAQTITNGIDLSGEGGLVWIKERSSSGSDHHLTDTERGVKNPLNSATTDGENSYYNTNNLGITSFNSNGFTVASGSNFNDSGDTAVSWTWRKAPRFFDCVTYTGNSTAGRTVSHNLGTDVGFMAIKNITSSGDWICWHRSASTDPGRILKLNSTNAVAFNSAMLNNTNPTSTEFTVGTNYDTNGSGQTYVAYLFAHNDGDGEFGPDADQDAIKCGSYTGTGSNGNFVNLGFEPQWIMVKRTNSTGNWIIVDNMRSLSHSHYAWLYPNTSDAEGAGASSTGLPSAEATGFTLNGSSIWMNASGSTYIYIAIRRGPMAVPESATDVFAIDTQSGGGEPSFTSGFVVDMGIESLVSSASNRRISSRLTQGKALETNTTDADLSSTGYAFDYQNGWFYDGGSNADKYSWMWKRAPNYFDVVAYTGNGVRGRTVSHNLGVVPEMMWIKNRDDAQNWLVYIHSLGGTKKLYLNTTAAAATASIDDFNNTDAEATQFTLGNDGRCNANNQDFVAYLFASLDGVSKVGSYTGTGTSLNIDCGFSSGARFVLIKRTDSTGSWWVFDTERGLVAGADAAINLNTTNAEFSTVDYIDPYSAGFNLTGIGGDINASGGSYIFYAIA